MFPVTKKVLLQAERQDGSDIRRVFHGARGGGQD
jgi:hypothetical protein